MKKNTYYILMISMVLILCMLPFGVFAGETGYGGTNTSALKSFTSDTDVFTATPAVIKAVKESSTSIKLSWKKVSGASGYSIYKWNPKAKKYRIAKKLTSGNKTVWIDKNIQGNVTYKYRIRAYKSISGKKQYGSYSETVSIRAFTAKARIVNVNSIRVDYTLRYLGLNGVKKVAASVVVPKGKTALSKTLTWKSSNRSIVKVNKYGWIEAQGKPGKAKVIIRAHNGVTRTLVVTVADFARPAKFVNLGKIKKWNKKASSIPGKYRSEMTAIAAWLERFKKKVHFVYEDNDLHYDFDTIHFELVESELISLLKKTNMRVTLEKGKLSFYVPIEKGEFFGAEFIYGDRNDEDDISSGMIKIAPCWYFVDGRNDLD